MKYYLIAGEASGDLHGSNLIRALKEADPAAEFRCWGGDLMLAAGATVVKHYRDLAFMGFTEVIKNLPTILQNIKFCKRDIEHYHPDAVILIDYPGFNLRIAQWAKQQQYKTIYYISPQVWAWKESRVKTIRETVDKMLVILPFEKPFYKKWDYEVDYVGHPLVEVIETYRSTHSADPSINKNGRPIIALLPGSRKQEILKKLPVMLGAVAAFPDYQFVVAQAPGQEDDFYDGILQDYPAVGRVANNTYALLLQAKAACVTSGTATLETALFGVPEVICYKGSAISYQIAKRLIKVRYISLVNLILDRPAVLELIQDEMTSQNIIAALKDLLFDQVTGERIRRDYAELKNILQQGGNASAQAAASIQDYLKT